MSQPDLQRSFAAALLDNRLPLPHGLVGPDGQPSSRRFNVYRNNVMVGLIGSLADTFPVLSQMVGEDFFRAMAGVYARLEPPASPVMLDYGGGFPDFVSAFPPLADHPYLGDVARVEWAWVSAYHAEEAVSADVSSLLSMPPSMLGMQRFRFHPSTRLIRSTFPVVSLWTSHQTAATRPAPDFRRPEDALILRPAAEVRLHALRPGVAAFLQALMAGHTLSQAVAEAVIALKGFDLAEALSSLFLSGAIIGWQTEALSQNGVAK